MYEELGMNIHPPPAEDAAYRKELEHVSMANSLGAAYCKKYRTQDTQSAATIYRGIVPARNIMNRDFAINGAIVWASLFNISRRSNFKIAHSK
jgi:dimethylaniline monooxygenase (N-oxide forming)